MIVEELESRLEDGNFYRELFDISNNIILNAKYHNDLIIAQMYNYDIHNAEHSKRVLNIIEQILGNKCKELSFYELLLIYMSAYLHDSAMALPNWEYILLKAVEGDDEYYDNTLEFKLHNDFKPIHSFSDARQLIIANKKVIYGHYQSIMDYVFIEKSEELLIEDLANLLCDYEEYRNKYANSLKQKRTSIAEYCKYSETIREEFIRSTHHIRVEKNVEALKKYYINILGNIDANEFIEQLKIICRAHGEEMSYIQKFKQFSKIGNKEFANVSFVAQLLRIGDIMHFDAFRAPVSLFAEKMIDDKTSMMHWKSKANELSFQIKNEDEMVSISFSAFCKLPQEYYFIQEYLDCVDAEIQNFYILKNRWEIESTAEKNKYNIRIKQDVNRERVLPDVDLFIPDREMKFVIEQAQILNLLTGVQLYKDKYLCLREIYQNAYDATKCMIAENRRKGIMANYAIKFGLGKELIGGKERRYIYCLDQGIGMDSYVIKNYLLRIGNSYYQSKDFVQKNIQWNDEVKPISQFGIGLLSGYMIADAISITTKSYVDGADVISFVLEGVNEHFYYKKCNREEVEILGDHGTLVKLYLKESEEMINDEVLDKYPLLLLSSNESKFAEMSMSEDYKYNLLYLLSENVGIKMNDIEVLVENSMKEYIPIISKNQAFDFRNYPSITKSDLEILWGETHYLDGTKGVEQLAIKMRDKMIDYVIQIVTENLEVYSIVSFPTEFSTDWTDKIVDFYGFINESNNSIFVDGISVSEDGLIDRTFRDIVGINRQEKLIINYYGNKRPILSVDRNNIVKNFGYEDEIAIVRQQLEEKLSEAVLSHMGVVKKRDKEKISGIILNILLREYPLVFNNVLKILGETNQVSILFPDNISEKPLELAEIFNKDNIKINDIDFRKYKEHTRQILICKLLNARKITIDRGELLGEGAVYLDMPSIRYRFSEEGNSLKTVAIKADVFDEEYSEFDLVSKYWPIVSPQLFDALNSEYDNGAVYENRSKYISDCSNSISGIAAIDPLYIIPSIGIVHAVQDRFSNKNLVGELDRVLNGFWLFELTNHGEIVRKEKRGMALFAFISPRVINSDEKNYVSQIEKDDPIRYKGIVEGWSILFLGTIERYIIMPGKVSLYDIVEEIPESYKLMENWVEHYLPSGVVIK